MLRKKLIASAIAVSLAFVMAMSPMLVLADALTVEQLDVTTVIATDEFAFDAFDVLEPLVHEIVPIELNLNTDIQSNRLNVDTFKAEHTAIMDSDFAGVTPHSQWWDVFPVRSGRWTGTVPAGLQTVYRLPRVRWEEINTRMAYSFILTDITHGGDISLYLVCLTTMAVLAHDERVGSATEHFTVVFPAGFESRELAVIVENWGGNASYTIYAGPLWIGRTMWGDVTSGRGFFMDLHNLNWRHSWGNFPAPPPPFHNTPTFSPIFNLDLRNHTQVPRNALMINPMISGFSAGGNASNFTRHMILPNGATLEARFDAFPFQNLNPTFRDRNGNWQPNPQMGVWADDFFRFRFSVTQSSFFTWQASSLSFGMVFPAIPANMRFL